MLYRTCLISCCCRAVDDPTASTSAATTAAVMLSEALQFLLLRLIMPVSQGSSRGLGDFEDLEFTPSTVAQPDAAVAASAAAVTASPEKAAPVEVCYMCSCSCHCR